MEVLTSLSEADVEAFIQVVEDLRNNERKIEEIELELQQLTDYQNKLLSEINNIEHKIEDLTVKQEHAALTKNVHKSIDYREEISEYKKMLSSKQTIFSDVAHNVNKLEEDLYNLDSKEKRRMMSNAEMVVEFILADRPKKIDIAINTHELHKIQSELAETFYKFKKEFPKAPYISKNDPPKQRFIRMIQNQVLKPSGEIDSEKVEELKSIYNEWKVDNKKGTGEIIDWLYSYNIFTKSEATEAKHATFNQLTIDDLFRK